MKKILILCLSLFLFTGCHVRQRTRQVDPPITIDTNYFKDDNCYLYHYETLSKKDKEIYQDIYNCLLGHEKKVTVASDDYATVQEINSCVLYDHPEIFYFDYFELEKQVDNTHYVPTYVYSKSEVNELNDQLETIRNDFINSLDQNASDYDKLKSIYDFVITKCQYVDGAIDNQDITSVLLYGQTVCSGYAKAVKYLSEPLGLDVAYLVGQDITDDEEGDYHAWNLVYLDNDYYYLDATWGDYDSDGITFTMYGYFMFDSNDMLKLYKPEGEYKTTTTGQYCYYKYENLYSDTYNKNNLSPMIKQYKNSSTTWMELKFSDSCYQEAKRRLIDQEEMFTLFDRYTDRAYSVSYFSYDDLNVLIFNQIIE